MRSHTFFLSTTSPVLNSSGSQRIDPFWAILMGKGVKKPKGAIRGKTQKHKMGENVQPLIDHWVNFSSLLLWLVSFLHILIYYDNNRLLLKQFIR